MIKSMFRSKKGKFFNYIAASMTPLNIFGFIVMAMVFVYFISYLLAQFFGTKIILIGTPFRFLIIATALIISFYITIKRQGTFERKDIFLIILLGGGLFALFYYLPQLLPGIFNAQTMSILAGEDSPFIFVYETSQTVHTQVQSIIPIP